MLVSLMWNGGLYGVLPAAYPLLTYNSCGGIIVTNTKMITSLGFADPREYFETGDWTWDTFKECLVNYTHQNNSAETVYGFLTS